MGRVFLLGSCRTPIGKLGGSLSGLSASELGSIVIKEALHRAEINSNLVNHVFLGCVLQAAQGQNIARQASLKAGLPFETTAETLNCVCGSGLDSVNKAAHLIQLGEADVVIAGGAESMSNAPFAMTKARFGYKMGYPQGSSELVDTMVNDGLWDSINNYHMGITAENVAEKWNISRREQDEFALRSQTLAASADFSSEIVPIEIKSKKGSVIVDKDEGPRPETTIEGLSKLKPVFKPDGTVTAGNASGLNDGAAAVVLVSEKKLHELGLKPEAEWIGGAMAGVDPALMGIGPVYSTRKLLNKLNMTLDDIDLIEGNEAFAAQSLAVKKELQIDENRLNVKGGAIALGHPIGCSGCRILVTLIHTMKERNASTGLAMLCVGGGMGCSTIIRKEGI